MWSRCPCVATSSDNVGPRRPEQLVELIRDRRMAFPPCVIGRMRSVDQDRDVAELQQDRIAILLRDRRRAGGL